MTENKIPANWWAVRRSLKQQKAIYNFLRTLGYNVKVARAVRHWRPTKVRQFVISIGPKDGLIKEGKKDE